MRDVSPPLGAEEDWNIDTQIDDGDPAIGKITSYKGDSDYPCTTMHDAFPNAADNSAAYSLDNPAELCPLSFWF